ncbi:MAG TPA: amidase [Thermoanaerobaculia bacterium]|nr:amidase [Thermoanaerobaculia bacterium]
MSESNPPFPFTRRGLLAGGVAAAVSTALGGAKASPAEAPSVVPSKAPPFELEETTIAALQEAMASGRRTSRDLVHLYLRRIEEIDRSGPALHAVIELNPEALAIAEALDRERKEKGPRGPLHGVPVLIKDNIATADRMETTAGSLALVGARPAADAFLVSALRAAGAVILGKTNLSEWANFRSSRSSSGWSGRGGQTRNPYVLDRTPSGSSSGTGAAIAASLAAAGIGTETDGSIVSPSSANGLVGIKPTVGRVSRSGVIPISPSQDTPGPMARTVADAALLLAAISGSDPSDPATVPSGAPPGIGDIAALLDPQGLSGARLGVVRSQGFGRHPAVDLAIEAALDAMRKAGAVVVDPVELAWSQEIRDAETVVLQYEFKDGLEKYLAALGAQAPVKSLRELIDWNLKNQDREMPWFGQETLEASAARGPLTDEAYLKARSKCIEGARTLGLEATFAKDRLDAVVTPTSGPAGPIDWLHGDRPVGGTAALAAISGWPSITVPAGFALGLPFGISFTGPAWSEGKLIRIAYAFEQITKVRRPPRYLPTLDYTQEHTPLPPVPKKSA